MFKKGDKVLYKKQHPGIILRIHSSRSACVEILSGPIKGVHPALLFKNLIRETSAYRGVRKPGEPKWNDAINFAKRNPTTGKQQRDTRRARELGAEGSHTLKEWLCLVENVDFRCVFCKEKKKLTRDHIVPLICGGTDYIDNIQPLCQSCNSKKGARTLRPDDWMEIARDGIRPYQSIG